MTGVQTCALPICLGHHVPKGYIYSAMVFSVAVEMLNLRMRKRSARPVDLIASLAESDDKNGKQSS